MGAPPRPTRAGLLLKTAARRLHEHARELAALQTLEVGTPLADSLGGVEAGIAAFEAFAELGPLERGRAPRGDIVLREPRGVIAILMPWCDPLAASCGVLAAALVAGNTVVLKPSEKAPLAATRLVELLDLGPMLSLLHGDERAARPLAGHAGVDLVIRPGEEAAGSHVAIVDVGVDPEWAAEQIAASAFAGAGQSCGSVERVHAHEAIADPLLDALAERARRLTVGPGSDSATELGPLIDAAHRVWVHRQVEDAIDDGRRAVTGGKPLPRPGFFYAPTVLAGASPEALVNCGETRGPVVTLSAVADVRRRARGRAGRAGERPDALARERPPRLDRAPGAHGQRQLGPARCPRGGRTGAPGRRHQDQSGPSRRRDIPGVT